MAGLYYELKKYCSWKFKNSSQNVFNTENIKMWCIRIMKNFWHVHDYILLSLHGYVSMNALLFVQQPTNVTSENWCYSSYFVELESFQIVQGCCTCPRVMAGLKDNRLASLTKLTKVTLCSVFHPFQLPLTSWVLLTGVYFLGRASCPAREPA